MLNKKASKTSLAKNDILRDLKAAPSGWSGQVVPAFVAGSDSRFPFTSTNSTSADAGRCAGRERS